MTQHRPTTPRTAQPPHGHIELGRWGEEIALESLTAAGYIVLEHNWTCLSGQVDIIARYRQQLVAIEVKTRRGDEFGSAQQSLTPQQLRRIQQGLLEWKANSAYKYSRIRVRVDLVTITIDEHGDISAELFQDVAR